MPDFAPLMVEEIIRGQPRGTPQKLTDFIKTVVVEPLPPEPDNSAILSDNPEAKKIHYHRLINGQTRKYCLDQICKRIEYDRNIEAGDIRHLFYEDIENIKQFGDLYLIQLLKNKPPEDSGSLVRERSPTDNSEVKKTEEKRKDTLSWNQKNQHTLSPESLRLLNEQIIEQPTIPWPNGYIPSHIRNRGMDLSR